MCKICAKPGHVARDCLSFMERKIVCKRWFMHDCLGKWGKGCEFENCRYTAGTNMRGLPKSLRRIQHLCGSVQCAHAV